MRIILPFLAFFFILTSCSKDNNSKTSEAVTTYTYNGNTYEVRGTLGDIPNSQMGTLIYTAGSKWGLQIKDTLLKQPVSNCVFFLTGESNSLTEGTYTYTTATGPATVELKYLVNTPPYYYIPGYSSTNYAVTFTSIHDGTASGTFTFRGLKNISVQLPVPDSITVTGSFSNIKIRY